MKTLKSVLLFVAVFCLAINFSFAQQMYLVHVDYVNPPKTMEYEAVAKEFNDLCKEHKPSSSWVTISTSDNRYIYVTPIENFAELDNDPFADMAEKLGDKFNALFDRFNACYDKHGNFIIVLNEELSYMPEGVSTTQEDQNFRKFYFIYHKPGEHAKLKEAIKGIKDLYTKKGLKEYYRIYHSGFGTDQDYYLVAVSSVDEVDAANKSKASNEALGDEGKAAFGKVMENSADFEEVSAWMRPDLFYSSK